MSLMNENSLKIILINTVIICLSQLLFMYTKLSILPFQLGFTVLIFLPINIVIKLSKMKVDFYQHWVSVYVGFFCSTVIFYILKALLVNKPSDSPPGEPYFDLFLIVFIYGFLQLLIFIFLNGITYIINVFTNKKWT
ncbi:hypothetical protein CEQ21_24135 [Niallia circulans]|uniref:Uncharacterized protein n=1 Tax=Niallia circulans TaxID=1397 RepID=A0A553SNB0_NIACI|nr:hypothetical protein CEQ21_24135 [Niallia circulans]